MRASYNSKMDFYVPIYLYIKVQGRAPAFKKSPLDLLSKGLDNFTTLEPNFGGLKYLCDNFYFVTSIIC